MTWQTLPSSSSYRSSQELIRVLRLAYSNVLFSPVIIFTHPSSSSSSSHSSMFTEVGQFVRSSCMVCLPSHSQIVQAGLFSVPFPKHSAPSACLILLYSTIRTLSRGPRTWNISHFSGWWLLLHPRAQKNWQLPLSSVLSDSHLYFSYLCTSYLLGGWSCFFYSGAAGLLSCRFCNCHIKSIPPLLLHRSLELSLDILPQPTGPAHCPLLPVCHGHLHHDAREGLLVD